MPPRAVYDVMVVLQWAARPEGAGQHATLTALTSGRLRLAMSQQLLNEIRGVFFRPELQQRLPSLTPGRAAAILQRMLDFADFFNDVPVRFSLPQHPKDNHLFDLAIEAQAEYLVPWESRLLKLQSPQSPDGQRLRQLMSRLVILTPRELREALLKS